MKVEHAKIKARPMQRHEFSRTIKERSDRNVTLIAENVVEDENVVLSLHYRMKKGSPHWGSNP
jgi:hypothetical protein